MVRKFVKKSRKQFSNVFIKENDAFKKREKFLTEYLSYVEDDYMSGMLQAIISSQELSPNQVLRIDELMENVDLNELLVNSLLREEEEDGDGSIVPQSSVEERITKIMDAGKNRLKGWDYKFIFGEDGAALLNQCRNRGGWLSDKQMKQVNRIEKVLNLS